MKKRPSTGQIKFVPFLRNKASLGHCKGGRSTSCRSAINRFTMYGGGGGRGDAGGAGGAGGACGACVIGACGAGSSWKEKNHYNQL